MTMGVPRQQMLLDLKPEQAPTLDNFVVGANGELLQRLRDLCNSHSFEALYVWGARGSGKSHLLAATADAATPRRPVALLSAADAGGDLPSLMAVLNSLDRASLEQKRPPTLPLLRELMQTSFDLEKE